MHKQIQILPGVYLTDFRKDQNLVGLTQQKKQLTNDVGLLLDQVNCLEDKILQLEYSINEIKNQSDWQKDPDFVQAVEQNWKCIVRFSYQMKEKVLRLFQLSYHPESEKIEELLKINRIQQRQAKAIQEVKKNITIYHEKMAKIYGKDFKQPQYKQKKLAKVQESDSEQEQKNKKQSKPKQPKQEDDKGVYI